MTETPTYVRDLEGFRRASAMLRMLLNGGGTPLQIVVQFGTHGFQAGVMREHLLYLKELDTAAKPVSSVFWPEGIARWKTVNDVLLLRYVSAAGISERLRSSAEGVAASLAFPLLEEIARRAAGAWDEDGILSIDVPESMGLWRISSKGKREPKTFKAGHRIVDLSHKLFVLKSTLHPDLQKTIENLDERMSQSPIEGAEPTAAAFFERLEFFRNQLSHGRRFEGLEAWFVTFLIALLYFWLPQSEEDLRLTRMWQEAGADGNLPYIVPKVTSHRGTA